MKLDSRNIKHVLNAELKWCRSYGKIIALNNGQSKDFRRGFKAGLGQAVILIRQMERSLKP